jgi:hypothetical protein
MKNVLHKETMEKWFSRWVSIELLACLYIGCHQKGRVQQQHDPSVELTQTECGWVSVYQTSSITIALI